MSHSPSLPAPEQVDVWYCHVSEAMQRSWLTAYPGILSAEEEQRHARFVFEKDRNLFLISRVLLKLAVSRYVDVEAREIRFETGPYGKPALPPPQNPDGLRFNLSHCHGLVVCGLTRDREIGVDCERVDRGVDFLAIARRNFAAREYEAVCRAADEERASTFYEIWTLKEAYVKALGLGLSHSLQDFSITARPGPRIEFAPTIHDSPDLWYFAHLAIEGPFRAAVAVQVEGGGRPAIRVREATRELGELPQRAD